MLRVNVALSIDLSIAKSLVFIEQYFFEILLGSRIM